MKSNHKQGPVESTTPFRRRGRIVYTLAAVLVSIGLVPLVTVSWKLIEVNREALTTAQQENQLITAAAIAYELDIHVEGLEAPIVRVAQTMGGAMRRQGASFRQETERILDGIVDERMPYLRLTSFQGRGLKTIASGELPEALEPAFEQGLQDATEIMAQNAHERESYAELSDPILLTGDGPQVRLVVSAPIVSRGRFLGVLSGLVDLQRVWESVVRRNRQGHTIYAVDRSGVVFASNNPTQIAPGTDLTNQDLVRRFLGSRGKARGTMPFREERHGIQEEYLGSFEGTPHQWGILVQNRRGDIYAPIRQMVRSTLSWALAAVGIAIIAAIVFARTLSNPAKRLAAASRAFASGEFAKRVEVRSGNELGELAYTFNRMADEIEDQIRRLRHAAEENRELFLGTIRAMAQAIDAKDPYTRGHSVRVNRYSVIVARQMGLTDERLADIHVASLMHDVGKIGIDDKVLQKPGKLTDEEFEIMKTHTVLGAEIVAPIQKMKHIIPGLRSHHEKWGGGGYPDALVGEQIPEMARIIAVADAFDAMTTHRPYQTAMTFPQAHKRLNDLIGINFEGRIVEAFNRAYQQGLIHPEPEEDDSRIDGIEPEQIDVPAPVAVPATVAAGR
ncbi:MAG: HD domain-containing protein [bacterium]|nr:HD domain-containing protein [bacterium]